MMDGSKTLSPGDPAAEFESLIAASGRGLIQVIYIAAKDFRMRTAHGPGIPS